MGSASYRSLIPAALALGAFILASTGATICYYDHESWKCSMIAPGGPSATWCGANNDVFCPDQIIDDPHITLAMPTIGTTTGHDKDTAWNPECTVTFKKSHCSGGFCVTSTTQTTVKGRESRVDPQSACVEEVPD